MKDLVRLDNVEVNVDDYHEVSIRAGMQLLNY